MEVVRSYQDLYKEERKKFETVSKMLQKKNEKIALLESEIKKLKWSDE